MKKTMPTSSKDLIIDDKEIIQSPTFKSILDAFGLNEAPQELFENLKIHLKGIKFSCPKIEQGNLYDVLFAFPATKEQRTFLTGVLAGILRNHQVKSGDLEWGLNKTEKALSEDHWPFNWNHIVHELKDLAIFGVSTGKFTLDPRTPNINATYAALISILTDAFKEPGLAGVVTHHLRATEEFKNKMYEIAAESGFPNTQAVSEGILKHQFTPPFIMMIILEIEINSAAAQSGNSVNPEALKSLMSKILNPHNPEYRSEYNPALLNLTKEEEDLLILVDPAFKKYEGWWVPLEKPAGKVPSSDELQPDLTAQWVAICDALQYVGAGVIKILRARGPFTPLVDATIEESIQSILGDSKFASFGASMEFIENDLKTSRLFMILRDNINSVIARVKEELVKELTGQYPNGIPYLENELPVKTQAGKKQYDDPEGKNKQLLNDASKIRSRFINKFKVELAKAEESGELFKGLESLDQVVPEISIETEEIEREAPQKKNSFDRQRRLSMAGSVGDLVEEDQLKIKRQSVEGRFPEFEVEEALTLTEESYTTGGAMRRKSSLFVIKEAT